MGSNPLDCISQSVWIASFSVTFCRVVYRGNYGLMQIRLGTARALGYRGDAEGLLEPATNMAYGVPYLAGAYRAAHGDEARALVLYLRGYHDVH